MTIISKIYLSQYYVRNRKGPTCIHRHLDCINIHIIYYIKTLVPLKISYVKCRAERKDTVGT